MDKILTQLVEKLVKAYGDRLVSVVLYGSAAAGDQQAGYSDYNILCVLSELTTRELGAGEAIFKWWRGQGSPSPLLLTEHEVETCTDCFAIEFHDIKRCNQLLHGRDVVSALVVDDSFYRAQVEHELRAKLLRLRQKSAGMLSDAGLLHKLLADSIATFCVLFRHALVLHGEEPPAHKSETIEGVHARFGVEPEAFRKILEIRNNKIKPRDVEPVALLDAYLEGVAVVIDAVDRLDK